MAGPAIECGPSGSWVRRATDCATRSGVYFHACIYFGVGAGEFKQKQSLTIVIDGRACLKQMLRYINELVMNQENSVNSGIVTNWKRFCKRN